MIISERTFLLVKGKKSQVFIIGLCHKLENHKEGAQRDSIAWGWVDPFLRPMFHRDIEIPGCGILEVTFYLLRKGTVYSLLN